ncbi:hypothetical protein [Burkholderia cenocepacia]|uniref:hypothetical protein n=1 Tax=Burkholderia cenocepacia TaxID=95486 RepID=UPI00075B9635|nr:hypothetical protein [Burkholderia cenocepacia]AOK33935.1 hypothetical protein WL90_06520 [Burkholderia cenocepacia]
MATKQPKPDSLKAKVRTSRMSMDISGTLDDALSDVFMMIDTKERREAVIAKLQDVHVRMCEYEAERQAAA